MSREADTKKFESPESFPKVFWPPEATVEPGSNFVASARPPEGMTRFPPNGGT